MQFSTSFFIGVFQAWEGNLLIRGNSKCLLIFKAYVWCVIIWLWISALHPDLIRAKVCCGSSTLLHRIISSSNSFIYSTTNILPYLRLVNSSKSSSSQSQGKYFCFRICFISSCLTIGCCLSRLSYSTFVHQIWVLSNKFYNSKSHSLLIGHIIPLKYLSKEASQFENTWGSIFLAQSDTCIRTFFTISPTSSKKLCFS